MDFLHDPGHSPRQLTDYPDRRTLSAGMRLLKYYIYLNGFNRIFATLMVVYVILYMFIFKIDKLLFIFRNNLFSFSINKLL